MTATIRCLSFAESEEERYRLSSDFFLRLNWILLMFVIETTRNWIVLFSAWLNKSNNVTSALLEAPRTAHEQIGYSQKIVRKKNVRVDEASAVNLFTLYRIS